jgi:hypothetical protein
MNIYPTGGIVKEGLHSLTRRNFSCIVVLMYKLVTGIRNNNKLREAFFTFTPQALYGIDFRSWYEHGCWGDNYHTFSYMDSEKWQPTCESSISTGARTSYGGVQVPGAAADIIIGKSGNIDHHVIHDAIDAWDLVSCRARVYIRSSDILLNSDSFSRKHSTTRGSKCLPLSLVIIALHFSCGIGSL